MPMVKLRAPKDASSINIGGEEYVVKDGAIEVPDIHEKVARSFGYGESDRRNLDNVATKAMNALPTAETVGSMKRADLLEYCDDKKLDYTSKTTLKDLRAMVWDDVEERQRIIRAAR